MGSRKSALCRSAGENFKTEVLRMTDGMGDIKPGLSGPLLVPRASGPGFRYVSATAEAKLLTSAGSGMLMQTPSVNVLMGAPDSPSTGSH